MPDVYLLTEGRGGEVAIPHLRLTFFDIGLALDEADGEPVWSSAWVALEGLSIVERSVLPDGRDGVVVVVVERGRRRRHRFVLATDDTGATETAARGSAAAHGLRSRSGGNAVSRPLTAVVVVAVLATLTALLLAATHVVHF